MVVVRICEIVPPILFGLFANPAFDWIVVHIDKVASRLLVPEFRDASEWTLEKGKLSYRLDLPKGYKAEIEPNNQSDILEIVQI